MVDFVTPVGRIVAGNPFTAQTKDLDGRPLIIKNGPNAGDPKTVYYVGLAIAKNNPEWTTFYQLLVQAAKEGHPNLFDAADNCVHPKFAWKIIDGDSQVPNARGKIPANKIGYPGHWIANFSSGYPPNCYQNGKQLTDPNSIKCGYFIRIYGSAVGNDQQINPGIYLNLSLVELVGYGEEIRQGPDADQIFKAQPAWTPTGMSSAPVAPSTTMATPTPTTHSIALGPAAAAPPAPAHDFLQGPSNAATGLPTPQVAPPMPQQLPPKYNVQGQLYTREQLLAAGWTDVQIAALTPQ